MPERLMHARLTREIVGVFYQVYNELSYGLLESVYSSAMEIALREQGLATQREISMDVTFRGRCIGVFRADMIVDDKVVLELKAGTTLPPGSRAQLINYLRLSRLEVGLLLHFGPAPEFQRVVLSR